MSRRLAPRAEAKPDAAQWALVPDSPEELSAVVMRCQRLARRRALMAAGAAVVPIPGVDIAADIALLVRTLNQINEAFGLTPAQVDQLDAMRRVTVYKSISLTASGLVGRLITKELVLTVLQSVGARIAAKQAARVTPLIGQAVAAGIAYTTLRWVLSHYIDECVAVVSQALPPAEDLPKRVPSRQQM
jgi:uncharacterized protein (DUF697 family)